MPDQRKQPMAISTARHSKWRAPATPAATARVCGDRPIRNHEVGDPRRPRKDVVVTPPGRCVPTVSYGRLTVSGFPPAPNIIATEDSRLGGSRMTVPVPWTLGVPGCGAMRQSGSRRLLPPLHRDNPPTAVCGFIVHRAGGNWNAGWYSPAPTTSARSTPPDRCCSATRSSGRRGCRSGNKHSPVGAGSGRRRWPPAPTPRPCTSGRWPGPPGEDDGMVGHQPDGAVRQDVTMRQRTHCPPGRST